LKQEEQAMEESWFEDELLPTDATIEGAVKGARGVSTKDVQAEARGIVRADRPRWRRLEASPEQLTSGVPTTLYQVRLGFQFDVPEAGRKSGAHFVYARCAAYLWPAAGGEPQPTVYDLYPSDLYEGEPRKVAVKFAPELKVLDVGGSLGEISTDVAVGQVEPVVVGWPGEGESAPYWELRPLSKKLLGVRHLWLLVEVPEGCSGARLAALVEGDLQTRFGPIPIGPRKRMWDQRPSVVIR
jgi:hypothetical protein